MTLEEDIAELKNKIGDYQTRLDQAIADDDNEKRIFYGGLLKVLLEQQLLLLQQQYERNRGNIVFF